ncbi:MAG: Imm51 family immunity protein [Pseudomonadota bacterium]
MSSPIGNTIEHHPELGFYINVFDHREESLAFFEEQGLQGGGPTWLGLITAALEIESPDTLTSLEFDDESDVLLVSSGSEASLQVVQSYVSLLMSDPAFLDLCIKRGTDEGYLE